MQIFFGFLSKRHLTHPNNDRNLSQSETHAERDFEVSAGAERCSARNCTAEIDIKSVDVFMTHTTTGPDREQRNPAVAGETCHAVVSHPVYTRAGISRRMINLPSRFEPPSYRHGYFNILKFHPKRAVYQNLRHKLRAAIPPTPLANPPDILYPLRCRDSPMSRTAMSAFHTCPFVRRRREN